MPRQWNAVYCRKSPEDSGRTASVDRQEATGRKLSADLYPGVPVEVYVDNMRSGADRDRDDYLRLCDDLRSGRIAAVLAWERSRLDRDPELWERFMVLLSAACINQVHTSRGDVAVNKGARVVGRVLAAVDADERERAQLRSEDNHRWLAEQGRPATAPGYGYRRTVDGAWEPHPDQAPVVERMVAWVADGWSLGAVAAELNNRGVPTARGGTVWRRQSVRVIVTAPRLIGKRVHNGHVVGDALWPPIVDQVTWRRAQAVLRQPGTRRKGEVRPFFLRRLLVCGKCGAGLQADRMSMRNGTYVAAYGCRACKGVSVQADHVEAAVVDHVGELLADPGALRIVERRMAGDAPDLSAARTELAEVDGQMATLARQWAEGARTDAEHDAARVVLAERRQALSDLLDAAPAVAVTVDDLVAAWEHGRATGQHGSLRTVIDSVLNGPVTVRPYRPGVKGADRLMWP
jgi:DNA invertase Pin-like site-specific DNA recombinase